MVVIRSARPVHRVGTVIAVVAAAAGAVLFAASGASAGAPAVKPAAGVIHIFGVNSSLTAASTTTLITGAFSDHGIGKNGTWHLAKGNITINTSKLESILNSRFGTFYPASCSFDGAAKATVPIVSGTKSYKGIKGSLTLTATVAEQGSLLKNGKCNEANNAPLVALTEILSGSGKVSF